MSLEARLVEVWQAVLVDGATRIELDGRSIPIGRTRTAGVRIVAFVYDGNPIEGIEQNPATKSRWAQLARDGKRIMQFLARHRYFANVCEGVVTRYPAWSSLGLPA